MNRRHKQAIAVAMRKWAYQVLSRDPDYFSRIGKKGGQA